MIPLLLLVCVAAVKVFKKTTPNGKVTVYLGKRDFVDHLDRIDPIDGVVVVESDYLKGRKVFGQLTTTYRYGREEDEVMGLKFSKEMILVKEQIVPSSADKLDLTAVQERLVKKFGANAFPFTYRFPAMFSLAAAIYGIPYFLPYELIMAVTPRTQNSARDFKLAYSSSNAPSSVTLQPGDSSTRKPLGVEYTLKCMVADNEDDRGHKRSSVALAIKKLQYAPTIKSRRFPSSLVSKDFTFGNGKLSLEVTLDKELFYHGEGLSFNVVITNSSRKTVKNIKCYAVQHCEITMINAQYSKYVASLETKEGCPITPGASFSKKFLLVPLASSNKDKFGVALDGYLKEDDVNLASSTLVGEGKSLTEGLGIIVSYSVRVKLNCGTLAGELVTDVPFKLMHPAPGSAEEIKLKTLKKTKSIDRARYESSHYADDDEENIIFEDFARMRTAEAEE